MAGPASSRTHPTPAYVYRSSEDSTVSLVSRTYRLYNVVVSFSVLFMMNLHYLKSEFVCFFFFCFFLSSPDWVRQLSAAERWLWTLLWGRFIWEEAGLFLCWWVLSGYRWTELRRRRFVNFFSYLIEIHLCDSKSRPQVSYQYGTYLLGITAISDKVPPL